MAEVQEGDYIQMIASLAGDDFSFAPDQVLRVGYDIPVLFANQLISAPEDEPRARPIERETAQRLLLREREAEADEPYAVHEIPPAPRDPDHTAFFVSLGPAEASEGQGDTDEEDEDVEKREQGGMERATSPAAERRETATEPRGRRAAKPPQDQKDTKGKS